VLLRGSLAKTSQFIVGIGQSFPSGNGRPGAATGP
jgi:hypothetical protein